MSDTFLQGLGGSAESLQLSVYSSIIALELNFYSSLSYLMCV